jgi:hypothetical protein
MVTVDPAKIAARRQEIGEEIARLQREADELDIVLKVLPRLALEEVQENIAEDILDPSLSPRPSGTPTNFEMVELVLLSAEKEGRDGLTASEIVEEIGRRYWPGLIGKQILPSIYQFAKKGRFKKTPSGKFKRIKKIEGSEAEAAEPS